LKHNRSVLHIYDSDGNQLEFKGDKKEYGLINIIFPRGRYLDTGNYRTIIFKYFEDPSTETELRYFKEYHNLATILIQPKKFPRSYFTIEKACEHDWKIDVTPIKIINTVYKDPLTRRVLLNDELFKDESTGDMLIKNPENIKIAPLIEEELTVDNDMIISENYYGANTNFNNILYKHLFHNCFLFESRHLNNDHLSDYVLLRITFSAPKRIVSLYRFIIVGDIGMFLLLVMTSFIIITNYSVLLNGITSAIFPIAVLMIGSSLGIHQSITSDYYKNEIRQYRSILWILIALLIIMVMADLAALLYLIM
jgi:hypothetical protein